jgi:pilus assembly protein Flp/PilA
MGTRLSQAFFRFLTREDGPTTVEYAVMLALIIVVCVIAITTLGSKANDTFDEVSESLGKSASSSGS